MDGKMLQSALGQPAKDVKTLAKIYQVKAMQKLVKFNQESKQNASFLSDFCLLFGTANKRHLQLVYRSIEIS
jgi:hypothetical protein